MCALKTVVFVCTGNTCRSQMAAALFCDNMSELYAEQVMACSAGLMAHAGDPPAANAVLAMAQLGINITANRASNLNAELLENTDLFVCMEASHVEYLRRAGVPAEKLMNLDISDPYGGDLETYLKCRDLISSKLPSVYERLGV
ncbi:MAG: low molecular weight phosphatase family protein [Oscillospiraceae bacterium]|nr:low molecular weight phosphatase family protein [Oscillospiraceae bacterium]